MIYSAKKRFEEADVFGKSTEDKAFAQYFIGNSYLNPKLMQDAVYFWPT